MQSGSEPFGLWGDINGIRADLRGHGRVRARGTDMGFITRVGPTGRTVACAKRERSWSSFARLWVCWADEDVGSFEGGCM